jgi:hypothetical protein
VIVIVSYYLEWKRATDLIFKVAVQAEPRFCRAGSAKQRHTSFYHKATFNIASKTQLPRDIDFEYPIPSTYRFSGFQPSCRDSRKHCSIWKYVLALIASSQTRCLFLCLYTSLLDSDKGWLSWKQFTAKQLNRQAAKASKDEKTEKDKLKKVCLALHHSTSPEQGADEYVQAIQQGHNDIAKIYAQNAIRKQNERLNLLRLGSRIDAVASRVQTAVTMRQVTGSMMNVVKGMDQAMKAMDLEKVRSLSLISSRRGRYWYTVDRSQQ